MPPPSERPVSSSSSTIFTPRQKAILSEIAHVGMTESEARTKYGDVRVVR